MKRPSLALFLILLLSGCLTRGDSLAPIVTISDPRSGTVQTAEDLVVRGYAMDDEGISAIRVNETDLLSSPIYEGIRGKKLVRFGFNTPDINEGQWTVTLTVEDTSGRVTIKPYTLEIDKTPPVLELGAVSSLADGRLRVAGVVRDNTQLRKVSVNEAELALGAVGEHSFSLTIAASDSVTITVEDSAGNRTAETFTP